MPDPRTGSSAAAPPGQVADQGPADTDALVLRLDQVGGPDVARVGRKAATLGRLVRAGLTVPDALVLGTDAARLAAADPRAETGPGVPATAAVPLPEPVEQAVARIAAHFDGTTMAVRSSATAEDLPGASFAGQYDTVLHVRGAEQLRAAIRQCWSSAAGPRVRAYRAHVVGAGPADRPVPIAVLVQRQLDPDVAGVAFTADPVTGDTDQVLVSAVHGLGDAVVDGSAEPDEWTVRAGVARAVRVGQQALAADQARAVAELARRVERLLGHPVDIEWAMADGQLQLLQARPVTALPQPPRNDHRTAADVPAGTWVKESARHPEPLSVLGASVAAPLVEAGLSDMFATYGGLIDHVAVRAIGGEPYLQMVPIGGRNGPPPPWWLLAVLARVMPPMRARMRAARATVRPELFEASITGWYHLDQPRLARELATLRRVDLDACDDAGLADHLDACLHLLRDAMRLHFHLIPVYAVPVHQLVQYCHTTLGWTEPAALALLAGTSTATSTPTHALRELATRVRDHGPAAARVVEDACADGTDLDTALADCDPELGAAYRDWCDRYAFRCLRNDPGSPTLLERPQLIAHWLRAALRATRTCGDTDTDDGAPGTGVDAARQAALARAVVQLSIRPARIRNRFDRLLDAAERSYPLREDSAFWTASVPAALIRTVACAGGARLAARGDLDRPDDVVQLPIDVLRSALRDPSRRDLRGRVAQSRAQRAWTATHPGPVFYGPPPLPPPDVRGLPRAARRLNAALAWAQHEPAPAAPAGFGPPVGDRPTRPERLSGVAGAPGRYTGRVQVVHGEADFGRLGSGDVLVCRTTDPAWSVLFGLAGGLVTDGGGLLSHAAIVAREHAVPAVLGTGVATTVLHDGDLVTVDGTTGLVTVDAPAIDPIDPSDPSTRGPTTADPARTPDRHPNEEEQ